MLVHRSPALTSVFNEIKSSNRNCILDLGSANKGCFELFSELSCKIYFEDMQSSLRSFIETGESINSFKILDVLGNYNRKDKFDVILAWDIFNYLSLESISTFFEKIQPHCKTNTLIYMLRYLESSIPVTPRKFSIADKYLINVSDEKCIAKVLPHHSTMELLSAMPNCFMQDTVVNQIGMLSGIAEHVVRFSPSFEIKHLITRSEIKNKPLIQKNKPKPQDAYYYSPSIAHIVEFMRKNKNLSVLDLGSEKKREQDKLVELAGSYYRIDLFSIIELSKLKKSDKMNLSLMERNLNRKFDVILVWDLFSFCTPTKIKQLSTLLSALSKESTLISSFVYVCRQNPLKPGWFSVLDNGVVSMRISSDRRRVSTNLTGITLLRLFHPFRIEKSFAFREGMNKEIIEYTMKLDPRLEKKSIRQA